MNVSPLTILSLLLQYIILFLEMERKFRLGFSFYLAQVGLTLTIQGLDLSESSFGPSVLLANALSYKGFHPACSWFRIATASRHYHGNPFAIFYWTRSASAKSV
jgi:hypothetical protein